MTVTPTEVPDLTYDQWIALSVEEAVDWWLKRVGMQDDEKKRHQLTVILDYERRHASDVSS